MRIAVNYVIQKHHRIFEHLARATHGDPEYTELSNHLRSYANSIQLFYTGNSIELRLSGEPEMLSGWVKRLEQLTGGDMPTATPPTARKRTEFNFGRLASLT